MVYWLVDCESMNHPWVWLHLADCACEKEDVTQNAVYTEYCSFLFLFCFGSTLLYLPNFSVKATLSLVLHHPSGSMVTLSSYIFQIRISTVVLISFANIVKYHKKKTTRQQLVSLLLTRFFGKKNIFSVKNNTEKSIISLIVIDSKN